MDEGRTRHDVERNVGQGDAEGSARIERSARERERDGRRNTEIDGIESEREAGRVEAGGREYICVQCGASD